MTREERESLLTKEDLDKVSEHRFYVSMSLRRRLKIRKSMKELRKKYNITLSEVLLEVMEIKIKDDDFIKSLKLWRN